MFPEIKPTKIKLHKHFAELSFGNNEIADIIYAEKNNRRMPKPFAKRHFKLIRHLPKLIIDKLPKTIDENWLK